MSKLLFLAACLLMLSGCASVGSFGNPPVVTPDTESAVDLDSAAWDWFNAEHYIWENWKPSIGEW